MVRAYWLQESAVAGQFNGRGTKRLLVQRKKSDQNVDFDASKKKPRLKELARQVREGTQPDDKIAKISSLGYYESGETGKEDLAPSPLIGLKDGQTFDADAFLEFVRTTSRQELRDKAAIAIGERCPELLEEFRNQAAAAPPLWSDRKTLYPDKKINPAEWIRMHYGKRLDGGDWEPDGLTMADINSDRPLYEAYRSWKRNHPEDDLQLTKKQRKKVADAQDTLERNRRSSLEYYHKTR